MRSTPAYCPACVLEPECGGFHKLLFGPDPIFPLCEHHNPPVQMIPSTIVVTQEMMIRWHKEMNEHQV